MPSSPPAFSLILSQQRDPDRAHLCERCGAPATASAGQTVVGDRVAWSLEIHCAACGDAEVQCGWDETPAHLRELLPLVTLRADAEACRPFRTHLLAVFRRGGATIAEAVAAYQQLTTDGIVGTAAEMELLKRRLDNGRKPAG